MDCVDTQRGGARSIDCFILFAWQTGDLTWLVSWRSVSDDARRDCYRWWDSDTSQSFASHGVELAPHSAFSMLDYQTRGSDWLKKWWLIDKRANSKLLRQVKTQWRANPWQWQEVWGEWDQGVLKWGWFLTHIYSQIWEKQNGHLDNLTAHYCCLSLSCQNRRQGYVKFRGKGSPS